MLKLLNVTERWKKKKHSTNLATSYDTRITYSWCCSIVLMCYNVPQLTEVAAKTKLQFYNQGLIAAIFVRCCYLPFNSNYNGKYL